MSLELAGVLGDDYQRIWDRFASAPASEPLSPEERVAIWLWSTPNAKWGSFNDSIVDGSEQPYLVRTLDRALRKLMPFSGRVYRGFRSSAGPEKYATGLPVGSALNWRGFTSSSTQINVAAMFGAAILFEIESVSARLVQTYSAEFEEYEALFPRDRSFTVVRHDWTQNRQRVLIQLKEL